MVERFSSDSSISLAWLSILRTIIAIPLKRRNVKWERERVHESLLFTLLKKMYFEQLKCGDSIKCCLCLVYDGLLIQGKFSYLAFPEIMESPELWLDYPQSQVVVLLTKFNCFCPEGIAHFRISYEKGNIQQCVCVCF